MLLRISSKKSFFCPTIKEFGYLRNTSFFTSKTKKKTQEETDVLSCAQLNSISWGAQVLAGKVIGKTMIDLSLKCTPSSKYLFVCIVLTRFCHVNTELCLSFKRGNIAHLGHPELIFLTAASTSNGIFSSQCILSRNEQEIANFRLLLPIVRNGKLR